MKSIFHTIHWILLVTLLTASFSAPITQEIDLSPNTALSINYTPDRLLVKYVSGAGVESFVPEAPGILDAQPLFQSQGQVYRLTLAPGSDVLAIADQLQEDPHVAWAEPDYLAYPTATNPNDPEFPNQWALTQIDAPDAWDITTGSTTISIAIIDSGIDFTHPDLTDKIWINPGEIAGNSLDDDNNGYIDDVNGWDFVYSDNLPADDNGHGTQVAGIVGASTDNATGVAGVCWNCRLMPVKVMQASGVANYSAIAQGVLYAARKGARVINISLGGYSYSNALLDAVEMATNTYGAVVIAGAGNDNISTPFYPAAYESAIAVTGTDQNDLKASFSDYGTWVDFSAPAVDITTTFMGGDYGSVQGTSYAAAFVSGQVGLIWSHHPDWNPSAVRAQIYYTSEDINLLNPDYAGLLGQGRINAYLAVTTIPAPVISLEQTTVNGDPQGRPDPGESATLGVTLANDWLEAENVSGTLTTADTYVTITQGIASFGSIAPGSSAAGNPAFTFDIDAEAGYDHPINFDLSLSADSGYTETINFTVNTRGAEELVSGTIGTDTIWTNDKTYIVTNNVGVAPGVTLTIQAGTNILFNDYTNLNVGGKLVADGSETQPIRFLSNTGGTWGGIYFNDSSTDAVADSTGDYLDGNLLRWVIIQSTPGGIVCAYATPYLSHVTMDSGQMLCYLGSTPLWLLDSDLTGSVTITDNPLIGALDTPGEAWDIAVSNGYAYVADRGAGLRIVDVSEPAAPFEVGNFDTPGDTYAVAIDGNYAYIADGNDYLRVVDVSDPPNPDEVGSYYLGGNVVDIAISGPYAYVANWYDGLRIVDISDPENPIVVGSVDTPGIAHSVAASEGYAYIADDSAGLRIIDVSNPTNPAEVGFYDTPEYSYGVTVSGEYAYIADGYGGLRIIDVSSPMNPTEVSAYDTPGEAWSVIILNGYAYVADNWGGLRVIDVTDPTIPSEAGFYETNGNTFGVSAANGYIYTAEYAEGIRIYPVLGMFEVSVINTVITGEGQLPQLSNVSSSEIYGSLSAGGGSLLQGSTVDGNVSFNGNAALHGDGTVASTIVNGNIYAGSGLVENSTLNNGSIFIDSGQVLYNNVNGGGVVAGAGTEVRGNNIEHSPEWGIQGAANVLGNRVSGSAGGGINISDGLAQGNLIANSAGAGIQISGNPIVIDNTFIGNTGNTIVIQTGAPTLQGNNLEYNLGEYDIENLTGNDISADGNWWGAETNISARIFDYYDEYIYGKVLYAPAATGPIQTAPAYVRNVTLTPESPVGIETVTFDVEFSKPMNTEIDPSVSFQSTRHNTWTVYDTNNSDLPDNWVGAIAIDTDGSKWFGTYNGATNFDGTTWTVYDMNNSGLPDNDVYAIAVDPDGSKWFGTEGGGVARFDGNTWIVYNTSNSGLPANDVYAIAVDPDGSKWFGTPEGGVAHFDGETWTVYNTENSGLPSNVLRSITIDANGLKWFGTINGAASFDGTTWTAYLPGLEVNAMAIDTDGSIWFGTYGAARFDGTTWMVYKTYFNNEWSCDQVLAVAVDIDGTKWFGLGGVGAARFDGTTWTVYTADNSALNGQAIAITFDANGSKWFGIDGGGVGALWNENRYIVLDNTSWVDDNHFRASYDINALIERGDYRITVADAAGGDSIEIAPDTSTTFIVDYAGGVSDITPPPMPAVTACAGNTMDHIYASWTASDPDSDIDLFQYAIGTTPGGSDVVNWTNTTETTFERVGLNLTPLQTYYISVRARNLGGLWSQPATPPGVAAGSGTCSVNIFTISLPLVIRK